MSDDEDFDLDSSTSFISEDDNDEAEGSYYRCPLRTLFALHDRYEEQRLAIWLTLPTSKRGKMTAFMRGGKDGEIGRAWDGLGMNVMSVVCGSSLISYGLAPDKLSKWTDLIAVRQAKRSRKKGKEDGLISQVRPLNQNDI